MAAGGLEYLVLHVAASDCQNQIHIKKPGNTPLLKQGSYLLKSDILELQHREVKPSCRRGILWSEMQWLPL